MDVNPHALASLQFRAADAKATPTLDAIVEKLPIHGSQKYANLKVKPTALFFAFLAEFADKLSQKAGSRDQSRVLFVMPSREMCELVGNHAPGYGYKFRTVTCVDDPKDKKCVYAIPADRLCVSNWLNGCDYVVLVDPKSLGAVCASSPRDVSPLAGISQTSLTTIFLHTDGDEGDETDTRMACEELGPSRSGGKSFVYTLPPDGSTVNAVDYVVPDFNKCNRQVSGMPAFLSTIALLDKDCKADEAYELLTSRMDFSGRIYRAIGAKFRYLERKGIEESQRKAKRARTE